jgi:hypothetical protein
MINLWNLNSICHSHMHGLLLILFYYFTYGLVFTYT